MFFDFASKNPKSAQILAEKISAAHLTPILALHALDATTLLESAYQETGKGRYSLLMLEVAFGIFKDKGKYLLGIPHSPRNLESLAFTPLDQLALKGLDQKNMGFLDYLQAFQNLCPPKSLCKMNLEEIPIPLSGIGYLGFEFFREIEKISALPAKPPLMQTYECAFLFGKEFLIFDHLYDCAYIIAINYSYESSPRNLSLRIQHIKSRLKQASLPNPSTPAVKDYTIVSEDKKEDFIAMVLEIKKRLYRGDFLQCVPSQSLSIKSSLLPLEAYSALRQNNPSPYMFYLNFGKFIILGTSPEVMVRLKDGQMYLRPIAGTRKRGSTQAQDLALEKELRLDEKENAEHLMLIDLARNDIGRACEIGSVEMTKHCEVERYSKVMHLVSEIKGRMMPSQNMPKDAIFASFPAGTISGAPKIEAIKTILELEPHSRGIYSGLIGYFDGGDFDSAIAIRTAIYQDGIYHLQAGAGIVADSDAQLEWAETQNKMLALFEAITKGGLNATLD